MRATRDDRGHTRNERTSAHLLLRRFHSPRRTLKRRSSRPTAAAAPPARRLCRGAHTSVALLPQAPPAPRAAPARRTGRCPRPPPPVPARSSSSWASSSNSFWVFDTPDFCCQPSSKKCISEKCSFDSIEAINSQNADKIIGLRVLNLLKTKNTQS